MYWHIEYSHFMFMIEQSIMTISSSALFDLLDIGDMYYFQQLTKTLHIYNVVDVHNQSDIYFCISVMGINIYNTLQ